MEIPKFDRLVRFVPRANKNTICIGQPVLPDLDVGVATYTGVTVEVNVFTGTSVLDPGTPTGNFELVERLLSPLSEDEIGTVRCIGLNYKQHAKETGLAFPEVPVLFMKPATSLADPWPVPVILPKLSQKDDSADYESELCVVIGKRCKNVSEAEALDYVLGYTASNDVSSRTSQFAQSQWCFSKGFDGSCPIGPAIVSTSLIPDPSTLHIRGIKNDNILQDCAVKDLIFPIPKLISFLSQGTTLQPGTIILTGTPAGVGFGCNPKYSCMMGINSLLRYCLTLAR